MKTKWLKVGVTPHPYKIGWCDVYVRQNRTRYEQQLRYHAIVLNTYTITKTQYVRAVVFSAIFAAKTK